MAPNLKPPCLEFIHHMIQSNSLTSSQMAHAADCSKQSILHIRSNLRVFGNVRAPRNGVGRPRSITPTMLEALCEHLIEKPALYQDEMALFLWDEFGKHVSIQSTSRALASVGWSKKAARQVAKEQSADLRDFYLRNLTGPLQISSAQSARVPFGDQPIKELNVDTANDANTGGPPQSLG